MRRQADQVIAVAAIAMQQHHRLLRQAPGSGRQHGAGKLGHNKIPSRSRITAK
ncbi:hypothetical protein D3C72_2414240 [compost metagenome]